MLHHGRINLSLVGPEDWNWSALLEIFKLIALLVACSLLGTLGSWSVGRTAQREAEASRRRVRELQSSAEVMMAERALEAQREWHEKINAPRPRQVLEADAARMSRRFE